MKIDLMKFARSLHRLTNKSSYQGLLNKAVSKLPDTNNSHQTANKEAVNGAGPLQLTMKLNFKMAAQSVSSWRQDSRSRYNSLLGGVREYCSFSGEDTEDEENKKNSGEDTEDEENKKNFGEDTEDEENKKKDVGDPDLPFDSRSAHFQVFLELYAEVVRLIAICKGVPESSLPKIVIDLIHEMKDKKLKRVFANTEENFIFFVDGGQKYIKYGGVTTPLISFGGFLSSKFSGIPLVAFYGYSIGTGITTGSLSFDAELHGLDIGEKEWSDILKDYFQTHQPPWIKEYPGLSEFLSVKFYTDCLDLADAIRDKRLPTMKKVVTKVDRIRLQKVFSRSPTLAVDWLGSEENYVAHALSFLGLSKAEKILKSGNQLKNVPYVEVFSLVDKVKLKKPPDAFSIFLKMHRRLTGTNDVISATLMWKKAPAIVKTFLETFAAKKEIEYEIMEAVVKKYKDSGDLK